ncbi:MAG: hypothetical protein N3D09_03165 [Archaeoglobaceae archaeon]|nr:hypothetical protein [Archaeoglobaceae archaeon]
MEFLICIFDPAKTIGKIGRTQGDRTDKNPRKNAIASSNMEKIEVYLL